MLRLTTLLMLLLVCSGSVQSQPQSPDEDEIVLVAQDDAEMTVAIATLDEFLALNASPPKGTSDFKLKLALPDINSTQYFWVIPSFEPMR